MRPLAFFLVTLLFLTACGDDEDPVRSGASETTVGGSAAGALYRGSGTVLESPEHGPELCANVQDSLPPQCGGVPLIGWDWDAVDGEESASGTTWGDWEVTGTWDGEALTLTEPPVAPRAPAEGYAGLETPCSTPDGGWAPVDPERVNSEAEQAAVDVANGLPDLAALWLDQSINPAFDDGFDEADETLANDPALMIINVMVTEDAARAETLIREVWGGALCVSLAEHTEAELRAIQEQLYEIYGSGLDGMASAGVDASMNKVRAGVLVATPELVADIERRFGDAVVVTGLLEPVV
jgi:hypothetical protein